jgi:hypothetical protein
MKKGLFLFSIVIFFSTCKNELVTVEGWKDIPVVYGLLSLNDTATYFRVEKAFVDATKTPNELAQLPDSLYYKDATVTLVRTRNSERFNLTQVNGNTEGYVRNDGIFAKAPNYLYKIKNAVLKMVADEEWRIEVQRKGETKPVAKATTKVIGSYDVTNPSTTPVFLKLDNNFTVTLETEEKTGKLYDVKLLFNYDETDASKPNSTVAKQLKWDFATSEKRNSRGNVPDPILSFTRKGQDFYDYLGNNIPATAGIIRGFKSIDFEIYIGGQEFSDYINVGIANTGITGSQTIPTYTNIDNGLGLFSSRSKVVKTGVKLSAEALDLLKNSEFTKKLNFR